MADSNSDRKVTIEELKEHSSAGDLWLAIDGKVYDVSDFMDEHPGGSDVMMDVAGVDATDEFEDIGHTETARRQMDEMFVGTLDGSFGGASAKADGDYATGSAAKPASSGSALNIVVPLLVVILAVVFFLSQNSEDSA